MAFGRKGFVRFYWHSFMMVASLYSTPTGDLVGFCPSILILEYIILYNLMATGLLRRGGLVMSE